MQRFEIKSLLDGKMIFACDAESLADAVQQAVKLETCLRFADLRGSDLGRSNLRGSDIRGSDLRGSNLRDSDLRGSDLRDSDLSRSDLSRSNLRDSDLRYSNLRYSNLSRSNLSRSDLRGSDLRDSNLCGSDISGSDLRDSDLRGSDLTPIRDDLWAVLCSAPKEVHGLRAAIAEGRIDGLVYEGPFACLVGTLANVRGCNFNELKPDPYRPAERLFLAINKGDTPDKNQFSRLALEWVDLWIENMRAAGMPIATVEQSQ